MHLTKGVPRLLALILFTCLCMNTLQAQTATTTYTDSFNGGGTRSKTESKIILTGKVGSALPGYLALIINFNDATGAVERGDWTLTVTRQNGDKSSSETGKLAGTISGGTVMFDQQGAVASVSDLQLTIKSGTGTYANVITGNGGFAGATQNVANTPPFAGTLTFTF